MSDQQLVQMTPEQARKQYIEYRRCEIRDAPLKSQSTPVQHFTNWLEDNNNNLHQPTPESRCTPAGYPVRRHPGHCPVPGARRDVSRHLLVTTPVLVGINLTLVTYHLLEPRVSLRGGSGGVEVSCWARSEQGVLATLPLDGLEFTLIALVLLVLPVYWTAERLRGGAIRGCPIDIEG